MRKLIIIFLSLFAIFILADSAEALSCSIRNGGCNVGEAAVFKISGTTNAHAELPGQTNYSYYICCSDAIGLGNSCSGNYAVALKLSSLTNAHAQKNTYADYTNNVCISAPSGPSITCSYAADCLTLGSDYVCLASVSGDTNAHVGDCNAYPSNKVCCAVSTTPDFSLSAFPTTIKAPQTGTSQPSAITVTSINNFNSAVTLSISAGLPTGATANFSTNPVTPPANGINTSTLTINTSNVSPGSYILTIQGQGGSPLLTRTINITLTVVDLSVMLSANPSSGPPPLNDVDLTAAVSGSAVGTINYKFDCTNDGYWDYTFDNISDNPKSVVDACDYATENTYTARVRVERDVANSAEDTVDIIVSETALPFEFSISINPTSGSVTQNNQVAATTQIVKTQGTAENVTFWATNLPTGVTSNFSPTNCMPNNTCSSIVTFSAASDAPLVSNWSINVGGTASGGFSNWATYQLTITAGGVAITPPIVTTNQADNVTQNSATLNGTLNSMGGAAFCVVWFEYKKSTDAVWTRVCETTKNSIGSFSCPLSGLISNTTYVFIAYAKNGGSW